MSKSKLTPTQNRKITKLVEQFAAHLQDAGDSIRAAAVCYYEAIGIDPAAADAFRSKFPTVPSSVWSGFCRIANYELHERLLFDGTPGGRALTRCDYTTQCTYIDAAIPVSTASGDILQVGVDKLTSEQVRQVFKSGTVRDLAEQRAWIETQITRHKIEAKPVVDPVNDIFVKGSDLWVGGVKIPRIDLLKYLQEMG